jgi:acyl carrier protein
MSQPTNPSIPKQLTPPEIQTWLVAQLAEQLGMVPGDIDIQEPFDSYGLNSAQATSIIVKAEMLLGFEVSPLLLWHYPTIASLSQRLAEEFNTLDIFEI